jgi:protein TonB
MQPAIFYRCLALSFAVHGLAFALGVSFLRGVPATATLDAEVYREPLSAEIVSESEFMNPAPSVAQPAHEEHLLRSEVPVATPVPSFPEPMKAPQKKRPRAEPKIPKAQSKVSVTSTESTAESNPNRPIVEGAVASDQGSSLVQASPGYHRNPRPEYPESARRGGREGLVRLMVHVDSTGTPTTVTVVATSGSDALDDSAVAAVRKWSFRPGSINGVAVDSQVEVPIRFSLKDAGVGRQ